MPLFMVRHAKAGSRSKWVGPDERRPLSANGLAQALALADQLQKIDPPRLLSSPYVRCVQTLEPLAERLGLPVEPVSALAEGGRVDEVLVLLRDLPDGSVLCSHGDVIPDTIDALVGRGLIVDGQPDWRKASTWVLERDDGQVRRARAEPPPT